MKNFKIKMGLLSLLTILAVSAFLTSCGQQEAIVPDSINGVNEFNESVIPDSDNIVFTLPEMFNNMSEEELKAFFKNTSEEDILALGTIVPTQEVEYRYCGAWAWVKTSCRYNANCYFLSKVIITYRRDCTGGAQYSYKWTSCC